MRCRYVREEYSTTIQLLYISLTKVGEVYDAWPAAINRTMGSGDGQAFAGERYCDKRERCADPGNHLIQVHKTTVREIY